MDERKPIALLGGWFSYEPPPRASWRVELFSAAQQAKAEGAWPRAAAMLVGACTTLPGVIGKQHRYTGAVLPMSYAAGVLEELLNRRVDIQELGAALPILEGYLAEDLPPLAPELDDAGKGFAPTLPT